jgi:hypothetical protein
MPFTLYNSHLSIEEAIEEGPETAFGIFKMIA